MITWTWRCYNATVQSQYGTPRHGNVVLLIILTASLVLSWYQFGKALLKGLFRFKSCCLVINGLFMWEDKWFASCV